MNHKKELLRSLWVWVMQDFYHQPYLAWLGVVRKAFSDPHSHG